MTIVNILFGFGGFVYLLAVYQLVIWPPTVSRGICPMDTGMKISTAKMIIWIMMI
jgi:hypothetical protein